MNLYFVEFGRDPLGSNLGVDEKTMYVVASDMVSAADAGWQQIVALGEEDNYRKHPLSIMLFASEFDEVSDTALVVVDAN